MREDVDLLEVVSEATHGTPDSPDAPPPEPPTGATDRGVDPSSPAIPAERAEADALAWENEDALRAAAARPRAIKFDALRIDGFKSFPDKVEILIQPGMTGVVGPNGCGKSNLLEALKWVMGERSAKNMRGGDMSDVIFGGTDKRPARNVAEVSVLLDNRSRTAPVDMNVSDVLDVSRRITRGEGGNRYRLNGSDLRYSQLMVLFQDSGSGPRSSGIVSQGRVNALIHARASERRASLEEAAGIAGLAVRRKETRSKIKEADEGLARAEEALVQSSDILQSLRRQARQAQRRREIDGKVREAQARVVLMRLDRNAVDMAAAREGQEANEAKVVEAMLEVRRSEAARDSSLASLPTLRSARSLADQAFARAQARLESLADQAGHTRRAVEEADRRIFELATDRSRQDGVIAEATSTVDRLAEERMVLAEQRSEEGVQMEDASDRVEEVRGQVEQADAKVAAAGALVAGREATLAAFVRTRDDARAKADSVEARLARAVERLDAARAALPDPARESALAEAVAISEARLEAANEALAQAEETLAAARDRETAAIDALAVSSAALARLTAEWEGLRSADEGDGAADPVSARLSVEPGKEAALAAALGESLTCGTGPGEGLRWTGRTTPSPPPPSRGRTLVDVASGAPEIEAALAATLLVDEAAMAILAKEGLPFGFQAVTEAGDLLRWDGLAGRASGDRVAGRLRRANRLRAIETEKLAIRGTSDRAAVERASAADALAEARAREGAARPASRVALDAMLAAREAVNALERGAGEARRVLAVAEAEVAGARVERATALEALSAASDALANLPPDEEARTEHAAARRRLADLREAESRLRLAMERLISDAQARRSRFDAILREEAQWSQRVLKAREERQDLGRRADEAQRQREEVMALPAASPEALAMAEEDVATEGAATVAAARALDDAERGRDAAEARLRAAEGMLASLREARVGLIAAIDAAQREAAAVEALVAERMSSSTGEPMGREAIAVLANAGDAEAPRDVGQAESRLARLERERENLGQVNFLAEEQLAEQERRYGEQAAQREDLRQTIAKLRQGLSEVEREARTRLEEAFRLIDANFGELFSRLFQGGHAHLRLVESEDILEAGLEIFASPPGKRLQVMSLLSGGEQSLTAMALIFAVFQANPAPVCVLDEVDAALDDANTDRLCRLVEAMAENDATRFLVVTHSPLTMARMNRLYGVTMQERGVSSVTMVDLDKAIAIVEQ